MFRFICGEEGTKGRLWRCLRSSATPTRDRSSRFQNPISRPQLSKTISTSTRTFISSRIHFASIIPPHNTHQKSGALRVVIHLSARDADHAPLHSRVPTIISTTMLQLITPYLSMSPFSRFLTFFHPSLSFAPLHSFDYSASIITSYPSVKPFQT